MQHTLQWYDYLLVVFYMMHFITPMIMALYFWLTSKQLFREYSIAFILLSYAGFMTYVVFPAMPPWMASSNGHIPPLLNITTQVMQVFAQPLHLPSIYSFIKSNEVAAVPSLHAAYPFLIFLFLFKRFRWKALLISPYVLGVWIGVLYLGEHYFIDVVLEAFYAFSAYFVVTRHSKIWEFMKNTKSILLFQLKQSEVIAD